MAKKKKFVKDKKASKKTVKVVKNTTFNPDTIPARPVQHIAVAQKSPEGQQPAVETIAVEENVDQVNFYTNKL